MAIAIALAVGAVVAGILEVTRRFRVPVAAALTGVYGVAAIAALIFLDVGVTPGGNIAGALLALAGMSVLILLIRLTTGRRRRADAAALEADTSE